MSAFVSVADSGSSFWTWLSGSATVHWGPTVVDPILLYSPGLVVAAGEQRCCRGIAPNTANNHRIVPTCLTLGACRIDISMVEALTSSQIVSGPEISDLANDADSKPKISFGFCWKVAGKYHDGVDATLIGPRPLPSQTSPGCW